VVLLLKNMLSTPIACQSEKLSEISGRNKFKSPLGSLSLVSGCIRSCVSHQSEVGLSPRRTWLRQMKYQVQVLRMLADPRIQRSVVSVLIAVVIIYGGHFHQSRASQTSQNVTVPNRVGSLSTVGSGTHRAMTPIQRANPIPHVQPTSTASATRSTSSRSPGIRTPIKRKSHALIQEPSTQDAPQPQDTESIANQNSEDPVEAAPSHNNTAPKRRHSCSV